MVGRPGVDAVSIGGRGAIGQDAPMNRRVSAASGMR
jgi:hypothetical protein